MGAEDGLVGRGRPLEVELQSRRAVGLLHSVGVYCDDGGPRGSCLVQIGIGIKPSVGFYGDVVGVDIGEGLGGVDFEVGREEEV